MKRHETSDVEEATLDEGFEVDKMVNGGVDDGWAKSMEDVLKPMYVNCKLGHLTIILQILNLQVVHGWKNGSVDELLALLNQLLPPESSFPTKRSHCKKKITKLGLGYKIIHTCVNGCVLFHKNIESENGCLKSQEERYSPGLRSKPQFN